MVSLGPWSIESLRPQHFSRAWLLPGQRAASRDLSFCVRVSGHVLGSSGRRAAASRTVKARLTGRLVWSPALQQAVTLPPVLIRATAISDLQFPHEKEKKNGDNCPELLWRLNESIFILFLFLCLIQNRQAVSVFHSPGSAWFCGMYQ